MERTIDAGLGPGFGMNPIPVKLTPRLSAKTEVARSAQTAATPSRTMPLRLLMYPPFAGPVRRLLVRRARTVPAWFQDREPLPGWLPCAGGGDLRPAASNVRRLRT